MVHMDDRAHHLEIIVLNAIQNFNENEKYLIENDLSERCICAKFAMYLSAALSSTDFKDYIVDVEYNRGCDGYERGVKRIDNRPITVDLIVHKRGFDCNYGFDNLICIEMKKSTNRRGCKSDEERLKQMTSINHGFCYVIGFMLLIDMREKFLIIKSKIIEGKKFPNNA